MNILMPIIPEVRKHYPGPRNKWVLFLFGIPHLRVAACGMTLVLFSLALTACSPQSDTKTSEVVPEYSHSIYLVRHAEKEKGVNPGLTTAGQARAEALKDRFTGKGIAYVYSSEYRRTLDTLRPFADAAKINIDVYDPRDLAGLADVIRARPGDHLVVGHSNTTPQLAAILCECETEPMPETEYDRMYEIRLGANGEAVETNVLRYGDPS